FQECRNTENAERNIRLHDQQFLRIFLKKISVCEKNFLHRSPMDNLEIFKFSISNLSSLRFSANSLAFSRKIGASPQFIFSSTQYKNDQHNLTGRKEERVFQEH